MNETNANGLTLINLDYWAAGLRDDVHEIQSSLRTSHSSIARNDFNLLFNKASFVRYICVEPHSKWLLSNFSFETAVTTLNKTYGLAKFIRRDLSAVSALREELPASSCHQITAPIYGNSKWTYSHFLAFNLYIHHLDFFLNMNFEVCRGWQNQYSLSDIGPYRGKTFHMFIVPTSKGWLCKRKSKSEVLFHPTSQNHLCQAEPSITFGFEMCSRHFHCFKNIHNYV